MSTFTYIDYDNKKQDEGKMNEIIKKLKDKQVLLETKEGLVLNQNIISPISDKEIIIKFNLN
mgnify:CR=1 FL=1